MARKKKTLEYPVFSSISLNFSVYYIESVQKVTGHPVSVVSTERKKKQSNDSDETGDINRNVLR